MNRTTLAICAFFGLALTLYWQVQDKRNKMALVVFDMNEPGNLMKVVEGADIGTIVEV